MHSINFDSYGNLVVKFEPTDDDDKNFNMNLFLSSAQFEQENNLYLFKKKDDPIQISKVIKWTIEKFQNMFGDQSISISDSVKNRYEETQINLDEYNVALENAIKIKEKKIHSPNISSLFKRDLMEYQKLSVEHMIEVGNVANFSVPGSGKTTITYAAISRWLEDKTIEKILVIGPTASFLPWEEEYEQCFGHKPRSCRLSGILSQEIPNLGDAYDLFLVHFQTAMSRIWEIQSFMKKWKTVLIVDESHTMKSPNQGRYATTALSISPYAKRRIVLSGTPIPNSLKDLWTQITFLWPENYPLGNQMVYNQYVNKKSQVGKYAETINKLFCRIKKKDLNLPEPVWEPISVELNKHQREIYNIIAARTLREIQEMHDNFRQINNKLDKLMEKLLTK